MVEDNIKITGVDDPVDHDYMEEPKIDINIDPPETPILPENPKESINGTVPTYETTTETVDPTNKPTINKPQTIKQSKETA